ncbi:ATP-binding cassette domain-containing protein [soil metagenome]
MIEVERVSKSFGTVEAVREVSLRIEPGVVTGLLGPNGAGKTTLIRMMTSFLTPTRGTLTICGHDAMEDSGAARRCIGYLPESAPLYPEMRVEEFLNYRASIFGVARDARSAALEGAMARCRISDMRRRRIGALSKGYRQRVGLAAAILHDPAVVILDEPSSGLDPAQIRELRGLIRELASGGPSGKRVVLLSSHYLPEVQATCDRIVIMAQGGVRAQGTPEELLRGLRAGAAIVLELADPPAGIDVMKALTEFGGRLHLPGVARVELTRPTDSLGASTGMTRMRIHPAAEGPDPTGEIHRAVVEAGWSLRRLAREEPTLEQVFMTAVEHGFAAESAGTQAVRS